MCETDMTATVHMCETRAPTPTIMRSVGITHARRSPPILALCLREPIASRFSGACTRLKKEETVDNSDLDRKEHTYVQYEYDRSSRYTRSNLFAPSR